ncbi:MAG: hypothetical protein EBU31_06980 [Proteobacteria bacterium]|nr:hypothetical protein [Pseudomonadota bacterium]
MRRIASPTVAWTAMMAITTRPTRLLLLSGALLTCACEQQTTTMDDALRAYDAKRYAESLRISKDIQGNATDPLTRQQAAYMAGRSASELSKNREARDAFAVASRSADPELAGRALAMQAAIAVEEKRWNDAASSYAAAASKLTGREAQIAREHAQQADAKANESRLPPRPAPTVATAAPAASTAPAAPTIPAAKPATEPGPVAVLPAVDDDAPWTISAGAYSSETAARQRATNLAREAKRAGLQTPRVLAVSSPSKRVWIVEIGTFDQREQGESARKKFATKDTAVVRSRVPVPSKRS